MGRFLLFLPGFILNLSPLGLLLAPQLGGLVPLRHYQFSIDHFLVLLLLTLDDCLFGLLEHFHAGLLQGLLTENVEHWLNLLIEVEKVGITFVYLGVLAILFFWHFWLEKGNWGPVEIELSGNSLFGLFWFVS